MNTSVIVNMKDLLIPKKKKKEFEVAKKWDLQK